MEVQPSGTEAVSEGVEERDDIGGDRLVAQVKRATVGWREVPSAIGVGPFVLDFYAPALRLGIELDGRHHYTEEGMAYDRRRSDYLWREHGIRVLRFENRLVFESPELVLREIGHFISEKQNGIEINIKHDDTEFD